MPKTARLAGGFLCLALLGAAPPELGTADLVDEYIASWKRFYPSSALGRGFLDAIGDLEDYSTDAVDLWISHNRVTLEEVGRRAARTGLPLDDRIDLRLLRIQLHKELDRWENDRPHERSLALYADHIADGLEPVLEARTHSGASKEALLAHRLVAMAGLARAAREGVRDGAPEATRLAIARLEATAEALPGQLPAELQEAGLEVGAAIAELVAYARTELMPQLRMADEPILGRDTYARKLAIYTDSALSPERLEALARAEIDDARQALIELSEAYWQATYPDEPPPTEPSALIARGFADLEANRPEVELPYLETLREYGRDVETFVREHEIATVPEHNTLSIELAPESAGPMARIGFVRSAPAFHPNPWTTWFLATIPDDHPAAERIDFWRSFNYSFKRFIVIHELFPGHYMQLKLLRENPHRVRVLFPYRPFIEGWATFSERIVLDAGYAEGDWLTRLAQLRKRLENANRAYMSVQAHCNGWSRDQVLEFSIETSLLAPQFAESLWGRLMRSPMQILTYMLMGLELRDLYEAELQRLGDRFVLRDFMDTILRTGPVPSDDLAATLRAEFP